MHFTPRTSFRGIEDVEYIPKFGYRNLLNPIFFHIIVLKDPKGYKNIKKIFELIKYSKIKLIKGPKSPFIFLLRH